MTAPDDQPHRWISPGPKLERWIETHVAGLQPPLAFETLSTGRRPTTLLMRDQLGARYVLRHQPPGAPSAAVESHAMRIASRSVPTVPLRGVWADPTAPGATLWVGDFVPGIVARDRQAAEHELSTDALWTSASKMMALLARLHTETARAKPANVHAPIPPLSQLLRNKLHRRRHPALIGAYDQLGAAAPPAAQHSLLHGNWGHANFVLSPEGGIRAVLDWKHAALGDPVFDVASVLVWCADGAGAEHTESPAHAPGFPPADDLVDQYMANADLDVAKLRYYIAVQHWLIGCAYDDAALVHKGDTGPGVDRLRARAARYARRAAGGL